MGGMMPEIQHCNQNVVIPSREKTVLPGNLSAIRMISVIPDKDAGIQCHGWQPPELAHILVTGYRLPCRYDGVHNDKIALNRALIWVVSRQYSFPAVIENLEVSE
jgi:hypothetical protein